MNIPTPYLVFLGDAKDFKQAKTAHGIAEWRPELCVGQMKLPGCETDIGLKDMVPLEAAVGYGAKTFLIGISPSGTSLPYGYESAIMSAIDAEMHIASPLHNELPLEIREHAARRGVTIYNFATVRRNTQRAQAKSVQVFAC